MRLSLADADLTRDEVPTGKSEADNITVKTWGDKPTFEFEPKPHWELGESLGILDLERAAKFSGARFAVYMGAGARLERALISFMLDLHTQQHGYTEVLPPFMVNRRASSAPASFPSSLRISSAAPTLTRKPWHAASSKTTTTGSSPRQKSPSPISIATRFSTSQRFPSVSPPTLHASAPKPAPQAKTPVASSANTSFKRSNSSSSLSRRIRRGARTPDARCRGVLEALKLPYRRVLLCTGDTGFSSAKTFDLEVWLPGQQLYREISSCSNFEAFQARRANIRFKRAGKGKTEFVHTINGSGLAVGRTWLAILENYQQADGSVVIPEALRPYMGGLERITK